MDLPRSLSLPALRQTIDSLAQYLGVSSLTLGLSGGFVGYVILCSTLRFQRLRNLHRRFSQYSTREGLSQMTNKDAHDIIGIMIRSEFPLFYDLGLRLSLMKTYGQGNIGKVLYAVSDLAKPSESSKRYEDTANLFVSMFKFPPGSDTLSKSVGRMNYLHSPYLKSGQVLNKDMLYVLYSSVHEPIRTIRLFEWRELSDLEIAAYAVVWKYIGDMMEIDYQAELGKNEWKDGLEFYEDLQMWGKRYEDEQMIPSPELARVGEITFDLLLTSYPPFIRSSTYRTLLVLMGERLRHVFSLPDPELSDIAMTYLILLIRRFFLRYLCLPRLWPVNNMDQPDPETGRIKVYRYLKDPWYVPATFSTRWGLEAWMQRLFGLKIPGDGGSAVLPEGFLVTDLGPRRKMGKGIEETERLSARAASRVSPSCPFSLGAPKAPNDF